MKGTIKILDTSGKIIYAESNVTLTKGKAAALNNLNPGEGNKYGIKGILVGGYFLSTNSGDTTRYAFLDDTHNDVSAFDETVTLNCDAAVPTALLVNASSSTAHTVDTSTSQTPGADFESSIIVPTIASATASTSVTCVQDQALSFTLDGNYASSEPSATRSFRIAELALIGTVYTDLTTVSAMSDTAPRPIVIAYHRLVVPYPKIHGQTINMQWIVHD